MASGTWVPCRFSARAYISLKVYIMISTSYFFQKLTNGNKYGSNYKQRNSGGLQSWEPLTVEGWLLNVLVFQELKIVLVRQDMARRASAARPIVNSTFESMLIRKRFVKLWIELKTHPDTRRSISQAITQNAAKQKDNHKKKLYKCLDEDWEPSQTYTCLAITRCGGPERLAFPLSYYVKIHRDKTESAGQKTLGVNHVRNATTIVVFLVLNWACFHQLLACLTCVPPRVCLQRLRSHSQPVSRGRRNLTERLSTSQTLPCAWITWQGWNSHSHMVFLTTELLFQATRTSGKDTTPYLCPALLTTHTQTLTSDTMSKYMANITSRFVWHSHKAFYTRMNPDQFHYKVVAGMTQLFHAI